ncbi:MULTISPECIES: glucosamine-6-phosphate deaminase [Metabacillus]|jgi:glucosamine-6-phosphate deaminase|uniref:Glucosamine-6-phosphate deaminase n=2 Tax=Metabacillus TaxID=2675233 RepID=A0A179SRE8_9BACI|nr:MULTISPECIES: glucosamine-6-phosphate deaminase [Metabacillus]OAS83954.1 glucosamine-6-phosphate deaminase [Metabacillus litoralis]QNF28328.1 glucosamine-6-phosphate deaminase [Metabacillus sp. KUDC1714]
MKIIEVKNYQEMSLAAAQYIINMLKNTSKLTLGLATGGTPQGVYQHLIEDYKKNGTSYAQVTSFNLDEYIGLSKDDPNSYYRYMYENLFKHINISLQQINIPSGMNTNLQSECEEYENKIHQHGGIDLQLLGIGSNGHIGFNEPGTSFQSKTHVVGLTQSTREANARYFTSIEEVPTQAITMGIQSIYKSKEILLLASGKAKQDAMVKLLNGDVTESFPASILKQHPNATIIADEEALFGVKDVSLFR